jgi:hypothetical protein
MRRIRQFFAPRPTAPGGASTELRHRRVARFVIAASAGIVVLASCTTPPGGTPAPTTATTTTPPSPTTPKPTTTPTTAHPSHPEGGWVVMDQVRWRQQLAQFDAMTTKPITGNPVRVSEFNADCRTSHSKADDPLLFPNRPGASHMHTFLGNSSTNAASTTESLLANAGSSCQPAEDRSAYWIPELTENGRAVNPKGSNVYYGSRLKDPARTVPFPQGFRMIVGDATATKPTPKGAVGQFWCGGVGGEIGRSTDGNWPVCAGTADLVFHLTFPDCWDGIHLDSPDHMSHVGHADNSGVCSGKFPVTIPSVAYVLRYPTSGSPAGFKLSTPSGLPSSMHGDAIFAWDDAALGHRVKDCIVQHAKCNTYGDF